jgi:hypothetical protein
MNKRTPGMIVEALAIHNLRVMTARGSTPPEQSTKAERLPQSTRPAARRHVNQRAGIIFRLNRLKDADFTLGRLSAAR